MLQIIIDNHKWEQQFITGRMTQWYLTLLYS